MWPCGPSPSFGGPVPSAPTRARRACGSSRATGGSPAPSCFTTWSCPTRPGRSSCPRYAIRTTTWRRGTTAWPRSPHVRSPWHRASRYGPRGQGDAAELAAELEQVLHVLGAEPGRAWRRVGSAVALVTLVGLAVGGGRAAGQAPSAEALYQAGALRAAADSFAAR